MKLSLFRDLDRPIFRTIDSSCSYKKAYKKIKAFASLLPENFSKMVIFSDNSQEMVCSIYSAWMKNACIVPVDFKSNVDELAFVLEDTKTEVLCTSRQNYDIALKAVENSQVKTEIFILEDMPSGENLPDESGFEIARDLDDLAAILYTSGTTGVPKGVMISFLNMKGNSDAVSEAGYFFDGLRVLVMLPCHHILPLMGTIIAPISVGGCLHFAPSLSPADISKLLVAYPVDMIVTVPRFFELLHGSIKDKIRKSFVLSCIFKLSGLINSSKLSKKIFASVHKKFGGEVKSWICGGAALDKAVETDLKAVGFDICVGFGMTECSPIISFPRIGKIKIGACGQALPCNEIRIVDGEIAVRGTNVTKGYYNRPEETAEQIRNGWLYTGDVGYLDDEGYLFITGRIKELLVLANGKKVNPLEIELRVLEQSSDILEIGVLQYENILQAIIRLKENAVLNLTKEQIDNKVRDEIILPYNRNCPSYRRIIRTTLTSSELPRTRLGKIKRHQLASYLESIKNDLPAKELAKEPDNEVYFALKEFLSGQIPMAITPDAHMEMGLGLDSLCKISLHSLIKENYGLDISEKDFEKYSSLRLLSEYIDKNQNSDKIEQSRNISWADIIKNSVSQKLPKTHFFHFVSIAFFKLFVKIFYRLEIVGKENIPQKGSAIIAPNHQTYLDGAFVCVNMTNARIYKTYFFAKLRNVLKGGFLKSFARHSNVIIMDHSTNLIESFQEVAQVLKNDNLLVIFPEGTRTHTGEIGEFKQSFAIFAKELEVPIIPVSITGGFEALKSRSSLPRFGSKIKIEYKKPIYANKEDSYQFLAEKVRLSVEESSK